MPTLMLVAGGTTELAGVLLTMAGAVVDGVYAVTIVRHRERHLLLMATGALCWVVAAGLWTSGRSATHLYLLLAGFLVLTIVGERLELSRMRVPTASAWLPLVILHGSVAARVGADLVGSTWLRGWTAHANVTALLLFVLVAATGLRRARRLGSGVPGGDLRVVRVRGPHGGGATG